MKTYDELYNQLFTLVRDNSAMNDATMKQNISHLISQYGEDVYRPSNFENINPSKKPHSIHIDSDQKNWEIEVKVNCLHRDIWNIIRWNTSHKIESIRRFIGFLPKHERAGLLVSREENSQICDGFFDIDRYMFNLLMKGQGPNLMSFVYLKSSVVARAISDDFELFKKIIDDFYTIAPAGNIDFAWIWHEQIHSDLLLEKIHENNCFDLNGELTPFMRKLIVVMGSLGSGMEELFKDHKTLAQNQSVKLLPEIMLYPKVVKNVHDFICSNQEEKNALKKALKMEARWSDTDWKRADQIINQFVMESRKNIDDLLKPVIQSPDLKFLVHLIYQLAPSELIALYDKVRSLPMTKPLHSLQFFTEKVSHNSSLGKKIDAIHEKYQQSFQDGSKNFFAPK